tara:strand:+ start:165 stop:341 length:177 start_codon:yes stop_codon:yes gene_type:complete
MWIKTSVILVIVVTYWGYTLVQDEYKYSQAISLNELGNVFFGLKRYDYAIEKYREAIF